MAVSNIGSTFAKPDALVNPNASPCVLWFQYGLTTNYGNVTSASNIGSGTNFVTVTNSLSGLAGGLVYHCQAVASNALGISYGNDITFYTLPFTPISLQTGVTNGSAEWGDYNNDGNLDYIIAGVSSGGLISQVWRNSGGGTFSNINATLPITFFATTAWGDFNNDGLLDLFMPGQILQNMGNGTFSNINVGVPQLNTGSMAWAILITTDTLTSL